jgi:peptidoglycan/xylan/chitin deacetylase (PgdA/CDA1 family)
MQPFKMNYGNFVISLDFELMWGVRDHATIQQYGKNIAGVHTVIPKLLDAFASYDIKATFATVGFLFFESKSALLAAVPENLPSYNETNLSPYNGYLETIGDTHQNDPFHYAPLLIKAIQQYPQHEISTHTFSHYYCLAPGQTMEQFRADMAAAKNAALTYGISISSVIFPRNQYNPLYADVCVSMGIIAYRGNEAHWIYDSTKKIKNGPLRLLFSIGDSYSSGLKKVFRRVLRMVDSYINVSGQHCYSMEYLQSKFPVDIPSSRLLRPYSPSLAILEPLRLMRIKKGMTHAAKNNLTYHLWWHPHNFGINQDKNFAFLEKILKHYQKLNTQYNFQSVTMSKLAENVLKQTKR